NGSNLPAQRVRVDGGNVVAINVNRSAIGFVELQQQVRSRGFAGAGRANERRDAARSKGKVQIAKHRLAVAILKVNVLELHAALPNLQRFAGHPFLLLHIQQAKGTMEGHDVALHQRIEAGQVVDREVDAVQIGNEHDHIAGRQLMFE